VPAEDDARKLLELFNGEISQRLGRQTQASDRVDAKVTVLIGLVLTSIPLLVGKRHLSPLWGLVALALALIAVCCGVACLRPRDFIEVPPPAAWVTAYKRSTYNETIGALIGTRVAAFDKNEIQRKAKVRWWQLSLLCLLLAGAALLTAALIGR
jgi:tetrahydromethanopterin S-methyltransferase subunit G